MCCFTHNMCMDSHIIYSLLSSRRRELGLSQQELAQRAGLRREKVNRIESQKADVGLDELNRLLDVLGLQISVEKKPVAKRIVVSEAAAQNSHGLMPDDFEKASFVDGSRARIINRGKVPKSS